MARKSYLAVARDADRGSAEASHRDAGLMQRRNARQDRGSKCGRRGGRERTARQEGGERRALVGLDRDPDAIRVSAPREDGRKRGMPVLRESLKAWDRSGCLGRWYRNFVDHGGLAVLEHGLPSLARPRRDEFDQLRLRLALRHYGCMVPLRTVAYVIVQPCVDVKDASCVEVCPVDCIHTDDAANMYYIDPDECIDCGACVDPCPVDAIFPEDEVPEQWRDFIKINADYFKNRK
jgi:NAD-dependent dihydropyrimidine dehydrogenase PreA subunit